MQINKILTQRNIGLYTGLILGGLILGIGTIILFRDIYETFSKGIEISTILVFRFLLMILSGYASASCFLTFFKILKMEKSLSKKVREEYDDFIIYARPLIEEVLRQRIVGELLIEKLEKLDSMGKKSIDQYTSDVHISSALPRWAKFQLLATLLGTATVGLFVFLEAHPWELVPYSVLIVSFLWYLVVGGYYNLLRDHRSYYIPAIFISLLPTISLLLRITLQQYQVLYIVFITMGIYIFLMVIYYEYLITGMLPFGLHDIKEEAIKEIEMQKIEEEKTEKIPEIDIESLVKDIEARKESKMKQVFSEISMHKKSEQPGETVTAEPAQIVISSHLLDKYSQWASSMRSKLIRMSWPRRICEKGKLLSSFGLILALIGFMLIFIQIGVPEELLLDSILFGTIFFFSGISLRGKKEKRIFDVSSVVFFLGIILSSASILLFQFLPVEYLEKNVLNLVLIYILGILLITVNILLDRTHDKNIRII